MQITHELKTPFVAQVKIGGIWYPTTITHIRDMGTGSMRYVAGNTYPEVTYPPTAVRREFEVEE